MSAPVFINKHHDRYPERALRVEAIQFIQDDPSTHWHVNLGHPSIQALENIHWVAGATPTEIADGSWVVKDDQGISIMDNETFRSIYELLEK